MRAARLLLVVLATAGLAACLGGQIPATRYYRLVAPVCRPQPHTYPFVVAVMRLRASPVYQDNRLLYMPTEYEIAAYEYSRWEAMPSDMLTSNLYEFLKGCRLFRSVTRRSLAGEPDLLLRGTITRFEEVDTPEGTYAELALDGELVCATSPRVVWQARLEARTPMAERSPGELARAMSASLARVARDMVAQMSSALKEFGAEGCTGG